MIFNLLSAYMSFDIFSVYSFICFILPGSVWLFLNRSKNAHKRYLTAAYNLDLYLYAVLLSGREKSCRNRNNLGFDQPWKTGFNHQSDSIFIRGFCHLYFKYYHVHASWIFAATDLAKISGNGKNCSHRFLYVSVH